MAAPTTTALVALPQVAKNPKAALRSLASAHSKVANGNGSSSRSTSLLRQQLQQQPGSAPPSALTYSSPPALQAAARGPGPGSGSVLGVAHDPPLPPPPPPSPPPSGPDGPGPDPLTSSASSLQGGGGAAGLGLRPPAALQLRSVRLEPCLGGDSAWHGQLPEPEQEQR